MDGPLNWLKTYVIATCLSPLVNRNGENIEAKVLETHLGGQQHVPSKSRRIAATKYRDSIRHKGTDPEDTRSISTKYLLNLFSCFDTVTI